MKIIKNKIFVSSAEEFKQARAMNMENREIILLNAHKINRKLRKDKKPLLPLRERRFF